MSQARTRHGRDETGRKVAAAGLLKAAGSWGWERTWDARVMAQNSKPMAHHIVMMPHHQCRLQTTPLHSYARRPEGRSALSCCALLRKSVPVVLSSAPQKLQASPPAR